MTSTDTFKAQFRQAMAVQQQLPTGTDFRQQHPDIYQLWKVLHTNRVARTVWATAHICPSMLDATRTEAQRQCNRRPPNRLQPNPGRGLPWVRCPLPMDGGATYDYKFSASQVSVLDFFHPDLDRQRSHASPGPPPGGRRPRAERPSLA